MSVMTLVAAKDVCVGGGMEFGRGWEAQEMGMSGDQSEDLKQLLCCAYVQMAKVVAQRTTMAREVGNGRSQTDRSEQETESLSWLIDGKADGYLSPETSRHNEDSYSGTEKFTPQQYLKQKLRIELVERALGACSEEKLQLQKHLQSSLQTAFELQEVIMKQKMVMEIEQMAAQARIKNREDENLQILIERDELRMKLEEMELTLSRMCNSCRCSRTDGDVRVEEYAEQGASSNSQEVNQTLQFIDDGKMEVLKQELDETRMEATIQQTITEAVYAGAMRECEVEKVSAIRLTKDLGCKLDQLEATNLRLQEKACSAPQSCVETVDTASFRRVPAILPFEHDGYFNALPGEEEATPLRLNKDLSLFRSCDSQISWRMLAPCCSRAAATPQDLSVSREAILTANLKKSEHEVEMLGNKVDEQRAVLEKVALLLEYLSKSGFSAKGVKDLAREIGDEIHKFDDDQR